MKTSKKHQKEMKDIIRAMKTTKQFSRNERREFVNKYYRANSSFNETTTLMLLPPIYIFSGAVTFAIQRLFPAEIADRLPQIDITSGIITLASCFSYLGYVIYNKVKIDSYRDRIEQTAMVMSRTKDYNLSKTDYNLDNLVEKWPC